MNILLTSAYLPPIHYFARLYAATTVFLEGYDHYVKQTYRNRCVIATASGQQKLTVPVEGTAGKGGKILERDVRISDHGNWRHIHWNAIASAYGESPFFEKRWTYLFDFNWDITLKMCELLDIRPHIVPTTEYAAEADNDYRDVIRPKHPGDDPTFRPEPYYQVFRQKKQAFVPNMSILDLLFNEGNEAVLYL